MLTWTVDAIARVKVRMLDGSQKMIKFSKNSEFDTIDPDDPYIKMAIARNWATYKSLEEMQ